MNADVQTKEQRRAVRRQPALGTVFRMDQTPGVGLVWNISTSGVSMLLHESKNAGETLRGELASAGDRSVLPVAIRVAHTCKVLTGDYFIGAQFTDPLSADDIRPFLG